MSNFWEELRRTNDKIYKIHQAMDALFDIEAKIKELTVDEELDLIKEWMHYRVDNLYTIDLIQEFCSHVLDTYRETGMIPFYTDGSHDVINTRIVMRETMNYNLLPFDKWLRERFKSSNPYRVILEDARVSIGGGSDTHS